MTVRVADRHAYLVIVVGGGGWDRRVVRAARGRLDPDVTPDAFLGPRLVDRHDLLFDEVVFGAGLCPDRDEFHESDRDSGAPYGCPARVQVPDVAPTRDRGFQAFDIDLVDGTGHVHAAVLDDRIGRDGPAAREDVELATRSVDLALLGSGRGDADLLGLRAVSLVLADDGGRSVDRLTGSVGRDRPLDVAVDAEGTPGPGCPRRTTPGR